MINVFKNLRLSRLTVILHDLWVSIFLITCKVITQGLQYKKLTIITLSKFRLYESFSLFRVLSPSFIFWCKTITKISAYFKCIVSCCCSCKKWNLETIPWIVKNKLYADDSDNHYEGAIRIQYYVNLWSAPTTNLGLRPRPHESWYFLNCIYFYTNRPFVHKKPVNPLSVG